MTRSETFQQTPIPIETVYFLNDAVKFKNTNGYELMRDELKFNRYYFDYPPEWKTSNTGEMIIGVRSIWTLNKRRHLRFSIIIRKYLKEKFHEKAKELYPDEYNIPFLEFINLKISDDRIDEIVNKMDPKDVIAFPFNINSWLPVTSDLREIYQDLSRCLTNQTDFKNFLKLAARNYSETKKDDETAEDYDKRMKQKRAEKVDNLGIYNICKYIFFYYTHNEITVQIIYNFVKEEHSDEYLAIYTTDTGFVYYFRIDILNNKVYVNEINENETKTIDGTTAGVAATINDFEIKGLKNVERTRYRFDYVFKKSLL